MSLLYEILVRKNLSPLNFTAIGLTLESPIDAHVARLYNGIYSIPYPRTNKNHGIARSIHGIQHVTRAAINIPIFANLYRRFGNVEALALTNEDIKLLQIAALFHDSAREAEGEDHWDQESALFFYEYVTKSLGLSPIKAKLFAEAIANKDADEANYFELKGIYWVKREEKSPKNIYQKLIHDADCLEIIRARDHFDANYLDFYKDIAVRDEEAFDIMASLITEARSLIAFQGDSRSSLNYALKQKYEHENAYRDIKACISEYPSLHSLMIRLSQNELLTEDKLYQPLLKSFPKQPLSVVTEESLREAMDSGNLFLRGIGTPSAARDKDGELAASVEIRKMTRVPGTPTRTKKPNNLEKYGSPNRSVSMIAYGAGVYSSQGFLIFPNIDHVAKVSDTNDWTGYGKKNYVLPEITREEREARLDLLLRKLKKGGTSQQSMDHIITTHNEILYRVTEAHAIYFTQDPTPANARLYGKTSPLNPYTHYLQALFLQIEYEKTTGKKLPIFEYSGIHNFIKAAPVYTDEEIVTIWVEIVSKLIKEELKIQWYCSESLTTLKIKAIYGLGFIKKLTSIDLNYSKELRAKIDLALEKEKTKCLIEYKKIILDRDIIQNWNQLRFLLQLPIDKYRAELWLEVIGRLGTIITDGDRLSGLLLLPLDKLNAWHREAIWRSVCGQLTTLIKNGNQLSNLLQLPLDKLSALKRAQILEAVDGRLEILIQNGSQLYNLLSLEQLNVGFREKIWQAVQDKFDLLIKNEVELDQLLGLPESILSTKQKEQIKIDFQRGLDQLMLRLIYGTKFRFAPGMNGQLYGINGMYMSTDYKKEIDRLRSQPIGTYLFYPYPGQKGDLILAFIDKVGKFNQTIISLNPSGSRVVRCLGYTFSSLQEFIRSNSMGSNALLKSALLPIPEKEAVDEFESGVEIISAPMIGKSSFFAGGKPTIIGIHGAIDYQQTLKLLEGQSIGTYLLRQSVIEKKTIVLALVVAEGEVYQYKIELDPTGKGRVKVSDYIFPSLQFFIEEFSSYSSRRLKKALLPIPSNEEVDVHSSEVSIKA